MKKTRGLALKNLSAWYVAAMVLVFPVAFHNNYIDIVQTKKAVFLGLTALYAILCAAAGVVSFACGREGRAVGKAAWRRMDGYALALFLGLALSTLFAEDKKDALLGLTGRRFGAAVLMFGLVAYYLLSRFFILSQNVLWAYLLGSGFVFLLDILHTFQVDLLGMKENLDPAQHYFFIGTMGNIDVGAGFGALMLPVGMVLFFYAKEKFSQRIYGAYAFLGFCAMLCCRCDTAAVCVFVSVLLLYWAAFPEQERFKRAQWIFLLWIAASVAVGALRIACMERTYAFDGLCELLTSWEAIAAELFVWGALGLSIRSMDGQGKRARRIVGGLAMSAAVCIAVLYASGFFAAADGGGAAPWLPIADEFGNYRGYIWKRSWQAYWDAPLFRKIFGYGMNQFPAFIQAYEGEMLERFQSVFVDAHSEYLQMLSAVGLIGSVGYFGMFASCLRQCVKDFKQSGKALPAPLIGIVVLSVYFVQAAANNPQVFTTPLYFVFLGILAGAQGLDGVRDRGGQRVLSA